VSAERKPGLDLDQISNPLLEYVTNHGCSDCRHFEALLARIQPDFPTVEVREVAGESARRPEISVGRGVLRFPIIVLDDEIIGRPMLEAGGRHPG
jgi:glutaredoxin